jgi:hypothetical protein
VYASFSAALKGLSIIRAFGMQPRFNHQFLAELSDNGSWFSLFLAVSRCVHGQRIAKEGL